MPRRGLLPLLYCLPLLPLLCVPTSGQDNRQYYIPQQYTPQPAQTYAMPSALFENQLRHWQQYQGQRLAEQAREKALIERFSLQSLQAQPVLPWNAPPEERSPHALPPKNAPSGPAEIHEFKDEFSRVVTKYIQAHSRGDFAIDDGVTGRRFRLKLAHIHVNSIRRLSAEETVGCVAFETVAPPKEAVDLDFILSNEDWDWAVKKVLIHKVNGRLRYEFDASNRIVPPRAAALAPRAVPRPQAPAQLSAEVVLRDFSGEGLLEGGDVGKFLVKIANAGPGPAYGIHLALDVQPSVPGLSVPSEIDFGDLAAKGTVEKEVPLVAAEDVAEQKVNVQLAINEANGFDTEPVVIAFRTRASHPPKLELAGMSLGGTGLVAAGEPTALSVRIRNAGTGPAREVWAYLVLGSSDIFMSGEAKADLGSLAPGQAKTADFEFFANKRIKGGQALPISLTAAEAHGKYGFADQTLHLVMGQSAPAFKVLAQQGKAAAPELETEDVDEPPASRSPRRKDAYAVVIGIEKYRDLPSADFAARDAGSIYAYLTKSMGFDPKNVVLLQNERATLTDLTTYLGSWLPDHANSKSRIFVFFSGHGAPDAQSGQAYLIPYDGDPAYPETKAFPLQKLYDGLAHLPTQDVTVVLDSCFSGAGGRSLIAKGTRPLVTATDTGRPAPNAVLLAAAGADQISTDNPEAQHGLLTYFLLKGLRGEADADQDGRVTTKELFAYLRPAVEREARKHHVDQSPVLTPPLSELGAKGDSIWLRIK